MDEVTTLKLGLSSSDLVQITEVLKQISEVSSATIFGSRAKGNFRKGSDIDICLYGEDISSQILNKVSYTLNEELTLPYFFDVLDYHKLNNISIKEHIQRVGVEIYKK